MTIRQKILELQMTMFKPKHQKGFHPKYPSISVFVPLKHDKAFGNDFLEFQIKDGFVWHNNFAFLPNGYEDICEQEIKSIEEKDQYEDGSCLLIHIYLKDEYLNAVAKKLDESIPNKELILDKLEERALKKLSESSYYQNSELDCRKYMEERIIEATNRVKEESKTETIQVTHQKVEWFLKYIRNFSEAYYHRYPTLGKTNQEIIAKNAQEESSDMFAIFLIGEIKKALDEHDSAMGLAFWLREVRKN